MLIVPVIALHDIRSNKLLLGQRSAGKYLAGYYEFPGGKTEIGELPIEALVREVWEEIGIKVKIENLIPITFTEFRVDQKNMLLLMYYCNTFKGIPYGKEEQVITFVHLDELENYKMPDANSIMISSLKQYLANKNNLELG